MRLRAVSYLSMERRKNREWSRAQDSIVRGYWYVRTSSGDWDRRWQSWGYSGSRLLTPSPLQQGWHPSMLPLLHLTWIPLRKEAVDESSPEHPPLLSPILPAAVSSVLSVKPVCVHLLLLCSIINTVCISCVCFAAGACKGSWQDGS